MGFNYDYWGDFIFYKLLRKFYITNLDFKNKRNSLINR